ncbi:cysteine--tRNA ligase [Rhabdochlamydiaceae symbiont of Dictyostelium giganteum]|uniref:cysteine--tRNA ligase n=1 Tax=Rhabdochlamydiaceae symbiont of Dictyostelium giganteum TaxID=3342349 RepID=UPI003850A961
MKLYNTETLQKELLTAEDNHIKMYTCGPTVYNFAHIGNFRTYVFEDLLRRSLKFFGFKVTQAMNITDIDDKTLKGALERKISLKEFTQPYIDAFFEDLKTLHIEPVEFYPHATDFILEMIALIETLIKENIAYRGADGSIYYAISKCPNYGRLSHFHLHDLKAGASNRVASDEYDKEQAADFVLWKAYDPLRDGDIFWESPFGKGRPGWHIECSAMAISLLGPSLDIHVGGIDNLFPHHENEIAQSEACTHQKFSRFWLHAHHLLVEHKKMSKSLGNFYTLRDLLKRGHSGREVRYLLLQTHYRTQLNFSFEALQSAVNSITRIDDFMRRISSLNHLVEENVITPLLEKALRAFSEALSDDLNISEALAAVFDLIRVINSLCDAYKIGREQKEEILAFFKKIDAVLAIFKFESEEEPLSHELTLLLQERIAARKEKNWALADQCRDLLLERGYLIEDTPLGARLKKITP